ncbi:hypothetical protein [Nocardia iowensis]|uniref:Uncharacterized protein n=1 Tax=Nocardia iowensis TaxID=204891 RepID=A0ABX8RW36_NOCIO|nr:hypothetical protein [Nocardia iowensis]QXN92555.1 hypothetical protein KV110_05245 [Nocardia iowensis]
MVASGSLDDLENWLTDRSTNTSTNADDNRADTVVELRPVSPEHVGSDEYKETRAEFRCAATVWEEAGEPQSGPEFDRLTVARERFISAQRPEPANGKDQR